MTFSINRDQTLAVIDVSVYRFSEDPDVDFSCRGCDLRQAVCLMTKANPQGRSLCGESRGDGKGGRWKKEASPCAT